MGQVPLEENPVIGDVRAIYHEFSICKLDLREVVVSTSKKVDAGQKKTSI